MTTSPPRPHSAPRCSNMKTIAAQHGVLSTEDSVLAMLDVMTSLGNKDTGMLVDWQGNTIPW
ncbi:hypothetical protein EYF80_040392 [Liparis tanakae]|uniref:Uncharacterized protein n=1 Tax=Liparis tanakae TaxID=230148 RepID=A0A4Z2G798_9TELE|nr:hypothetical protein EYF80_040392 [Liparis tanakae]